MLIGRFFLLLGVMFFSIVNVKCNEINHVELIKKENNDDQTLENQTKDTTIKKIGKVAFCVMISIAVPLSLYYYGFFNSKYTGIRNAFNTIYEKNLLSCEVPFSDQDKGANTRKRNILLRALSEIKEQNNITENEKKWSSEQIEYIQNYASRLIERLNYEHIENSRPKTIIKNNCRCVVSRFH
jgi:hypothetical protein